jgi:hypothetical protein
MKAAKIVAAAVFTLALAASILVVGGVLLDEAGILREVWLLAASVTFLLFAPIIWLVVDRLLDLVKPASSQRYRIRLVRRTHHRTEPRETTDAPELRSQWSRTIAAGHVVGSHVCRDCGHNEIELTDEHGNDIRIVSSLPQQRALAGWGLGVFCVEMK